MRASYLMAHVEDVIRLRESFDRGAEWTRDQAAKRWGWSDRRFRKAVNELRQSGYPVISTSEHGSAYRRAKDIAELDAFIERELVSRSRDIEEQIRALREGAPRHFGTPQLSLAI